MFFIYFYQVLKLQNTPYIYILIFLLNFQYINSQRYELKISINDSIKKSTLEKLTLKKKKYKILEIDSTIDSLQLEFEKIGYFNNRLDSLVNKDSVYVAYFFLGKHFKKIRVFYDNKLIDRKDLFELSKNISKDYFEIQIDKLPNIMNQLIGHFEKQGKSFTKASLSEIKTRGEYLTSKLIIKVSDKRTVDKIIIKGYTSFPLSFIKNYLNLNTNAIFSSKKIELLSRKIKSLSFVKETKPSEVLFTNDSTYLYMYLKKEKANRFDGLIGFSSDENSDKLSFNGYLNLELNNVLNSGEQIALNWRNNGSNRQFFELNFELPYLFNSPITPKLGLNIFKQDSSFINTKTNLELGYFLNYQNKISLTYDSENSSSLLNVPTTEVLDYKSNFLGVSYHFKILNTAELFSEKFNLYVDLKSGNRKLDKIKTNQSSILFKSNFLWSLNARNHIYANNFTGLLISDDYLINELYRIGGIDDLRGFNEDSIFASSYSIFNLEYRYNTGQFSYLYTISDIGFIQNKLANSNNRLYGLGLGYSFSTTIGFLDLGYTLGKFDKMPFNLDNSRFHLKIINSF